MLNQYLLLFPFCVCVCVPSVCVCVCGGGVANLQGSLWCPSLFFFLKIVVLIKRAVVGFYCVLAIVWVSVLECLFLGSGCDGWLICGL